MAGIIVFGQGYLGKRITDALGYTLAPKFDVLDSRTLRDYLNNELPEVVINAIGKTGRPNVDWCETHKEETMSSNVTAALNLGGECSKRGIYFVHLGSGCVYQGYNDGRGFSEQDEPNFFGPQFYAKTKILAEKALKELPGQVLQLRIRMPIDDRPNERNLVDKLVGYSNKSGVIDIQNSMNTVPHMLYAIQRLIEKKATGIYNLTNPGTMSAAEIMQMYAEIVDPSHRFKLLSLEELDKQVLAKRSNCMLDTSKLQSEGIKLPEIHDAVRECLTYYRQEIGK